MTNRRGNRGSALMAVMFAILALTSLVLIGQTARRTETKFEDRTRCRAAARWAAESAINRGLARLDRGAGLNGVSGHLGEDATYRLNATRTGNLAQLEGQGECTARGRTVTSTIRVMAKPTAKGWNIIRFVEGPR